ncbi:MAG: hypothetical protein ACQEP9_01905 [Bacillota bacterium]
MNQFVEINYNYSMLTELIKDLKCKVVTVIIKAGGNCKNKGCCCSQKGYLCKLNHNVLQLFNEKKNRDIYIPVDSIAVIIISGQSKTKKENTTDKQHENNEIKGANGQEAVTDETDSNKDIGEVDNTVEKDKTEDEEKKEIKKEDNKNSQIYGYGRKINIDFLKEKRNFAVTEINITELSLSICSVKEVENNFVYYFHKDGINDQAIELLLSPAGPGCIEKVTTNRAETKAIIKGQGLLYIDSKDKGEYDFKLLVTSNKVVIKINDKDRILEKHDKNLVGVCEQKETPFIINNE